MSVRDVVAAPVRVATAPLRAVDGVLGALAPAGRRNRRRWHRPDRLHLEVRTAARPGSEALAARLVDAVEAVEGVRWAAVNGELGRLVVDFDERTVDVDVLVGVVERVEDDAGVAGERFPAVLTEQPGDGEAVARAALGVVSDLVGLGASAASTVLRLSPVPIELASAVSFVDNEPRLRRLAVRLVGPNLADLGLGATTAVAHGLAQGWLSLALDATTRSIGVVGAIERRAAWTGLEAELCALPEHVACGPARRLERPEPLPRGPVEVYADRAWVATLAGGAFSALATRSLPRSLGLMVAAIPKPARYGREVFRSLLQVVVSRRGTLVLDDGALERLDRVDTLVVDLASLTNGMRRVDALALVDHDGDEDAARRRIASLFDPEEPEALRRHRSWRVGPAEALGVAPPDQLLDDLDVDASAVSLLLHEEEVVAGFTTAPDLTAEGHALIEAARRAELMVAIGGDDAAVSERFGGHLLIDGDDGLADAVRMLQHDGCGVVVVGDRSDALRAADVGIGIRSASRVPWGAHLLCADVVDACLLVDAVGVAHQVSRQSSALALGGSSVASMLVLTSRIRPVARGNLAVNVAAALAMANGARAALALARRPEPELTVERWHELESDEVLARLGVDGDGLSSAEAARRRGPDVGREPEWLHLLRAVAAELANPLTPVLAGGAALSTSVGSPTDGALVASVTALNALLGGIQRNAAERAVRALDARAAARAVVRRDGATTEVDARTLVPGDVVLLQAGVTVPADCRILESTDLEVDEATITGESLPVPKGPAAVFGAVLADRSSMVYEGTAVSVGEGRAVVVATGDRTESAGAGALAPSASGVGVESRLEDLTSTTLPLVVGSGGVLALTSLLRGQPLRQALAGGVSLAVAAVPEGLPILATLAQVSAARRLSQHDVLVRNPRAIEALGRAEVLCTDKTGTLTEGRITLRLVHDVNTARPADDLDEPHRGVLAAALRATPRRDEELPHATDRSVAEAAGDLAPDHDVPGWEELDELPFDHSRSYHATLGRTDAGRLLSVKGAPEAVLPRCDRGPDGRELGDDDRRRLAELVDELARQRLRLLAVAERELPADRDADGNGPQDGLLDDDDVQGLAVRGFLGLADPVRPVAAEAVADVRRAGVEVVMVTGDHPSTAEAVAAELGILNGGVLTGVELAELNEGDAQRRITESSVFARVTPADKVRIVEAFQRAGHPVVMAGDGANDAAAMRLAEAGVAVGRATPAAQAAADVIITDERIETIVESIIEGRAMWASVREALGLLLGGNVGEVAFTVLVGSILGRPPLSARQLLLVNLLTDVAPALAIATRPPPDRSPDALLQEGPERSLSGPLREAIAVRGTATGLSATVAWTLARLTGRRPRADTVGLVTVVGTQLGQTLVSGKADRTVVAASVGSAAVLAGIVATPGVSQFFGCTPLGPLGWSIATGAAAGGTVAAAVTPRALEAAGRAVPAPLRPVLERLLPWAA